MTNDTITRAALQGFAEETITPSRARAIRMLEAGHLTVTLSAIGRDRHASFRFTPRHDRNQLRVPNKYWCSTGDGRYVGQVDVDRDARATLRLTHRSLEDRAQRYAAQLVLDWLNGDDLADVRGRAYAVAIADKCGRCGRELTTPESIERGVGPECEKQLAGASRPRRSRPA